MVSIGEREVSMSKGWIAQFKDGSVICQDDMEWNSVPQKKNIRRMVMKWEDRIWSFDDKQNYTVPTIRGYMDISLGGSTQGVDSRTIGYYDTEDKCKVILRVEESTGKATYEIIPFE